MNKINWNFKRHFSVELQKKSNDAERQAYIQASPTVFHLQLSLYFPVRLQRAPSFSLSGCVFHTLFNIKGLGCFRKKNLFKRMYFPLTCISRFVCQHKRTGAGLFCAWESVCVFVRSLLGRWCRPAKGPIWLLWGRRRALPRPASWARYSLSCCCPASTVCHFFFFQHHVPHGENIAHTSRLSHCSPTSRPSVSPRR